MISLVKTGCLAGAALLVSVLLAGAQTPAFPGALGFGANATGGRNGSVYHVTTLADSGAGSLRTGLTSGNRTIVFDVGGEIKLLTAISCSSGLTIAGQTAPGGIVIDGGEISFANRNNIICRYIRVRPGSDTASTGDDALSFYRASNLMLDHVSIAFAPWNNIDGVGDSTHLVTDISIQNSINANPTGQQFGCHAESVGGSWSWQYNIFANSHNRNPLAKVNDTFINNLEYNNSAGYTTHTSTKFKHDIVNNYFIWGPASGSNFPWYQMDNNQSIYFTGNLNDSDKNGALGGSITAPLPGYQGGGTILSSPWSSWTTIIPTMSTALSYRYNVSVAGAWPRDEVDSLIISQIKTLGTGGPGGGLYTSQTQTGLGNNGYGTLTPLTAATDTDNDGMPDYWELATGSATNSYNTLTNTADGYTLLEHYLNYLAAPHVVTRTNTPVTVNLSQFTAGFAASSTFSVTNITNGTIGIVNGTNAQFTPTANFTGLGTFTFTVTEGSYAISAPVVVCVTPIAPPASATNFFGAIVTVATNAAATVIVQPNNLTWRGDGTANVWNTSVSNWLNGAALAKYKDGDVVTIDDTGSNTPSINLSATVAPGAILFDDDKNYTVAGSGALSGAGSLSKTGTGTVTISTVNSGYSGAVNLSGGTLAMSSGSSIGSGAFTLSGGSTLSLANSGTAIIIAGNVTVPSGENVTITSGYVANGGYGSFISGDSTSVLNLVGSQSFGGTSSSQFSGFSGTINIASGSIRFSANSSGNNYGSLTPNFILNGTLQPRNAGNTITLGALNGSGQLTGPQSNAGTGNTVYNIGGKNSDATFNGIITSNTAVAGSLVSFNKLGTGTQILNGNNTFTGTNAVLAGALLVNGINTPASTIVFTNATLGGSGSFSGPVTVKSGGILSPGAAGSGSIGTLTISNNLTLNASAAHYFDLTSSPGGVNDQILIPGGLLTMSNPQNFVFNLVNNALGAGYYYLITGGTNTSAAGVGFTSNLPGGSRQTFAIERPSSGDGNCYVRLHVTGGAAALVWKGTNGNVWDLSTTTNWLNAGGADVFYNLDQIVFNDTSTNGGVSISGNVSPATLLVTNNATSFTFSNGVISGFTALVKNGPGVLTLAASNSFAGGVTINGGTVNVNNGYALGTGAVAMNNSTLHFNSVGTADSITATGTNTLQMSSSSANIYAGFNLAGGGRLNLTIDGNNVFSPNGDWSGFGGYIYFTGGKWLRALSQNVGSANAVWDLGTSTAGIYNQFGGDTIYLGALFGGSGTALSGASTATATETLYVIGDLNTNCTFNGVISDGAAADTAIIKSGNAMLTLTGNNTFTGDITVNSGTLRANNTAGSATGVTNNLEIFSGATLTGNGIIGSATTVDNGAIFAPGDPSGTLTISNSLTLNDSSLLQFSLGTVSDSVKVSGNLFLTGQLSVTNAAGFGPGSYSLFTCGGALTFDNLVLVSAPAGYNYSFDTNTPGVVKLVATLPVVNSSSVVNGKMIFSGTGGSNNATFYVVASTNLAAPISNWIFVLTNQFDANGNFAVTNILPATNAQYFYRIKLQ